MFLSQLPAYVAEQRQTLREQILHVTPDLFTSVALRVFRYQAVHNPIYRQYLYHLNVTPNHITDLHRVPFMPIGFFKNHAILTGLSGEEADEPALLTFSSKRHYRADDQPPLRARPGPVRCRQHPHF